MSDPDRINRYDPQQQEGVVHDTQALWRPVQAEAALQHHCEPSVPNGQPKVRLDRQRYPAPGFTRPFTAAELDIGIRVLKNGKAPGRDDIQTVLIKQFGPKTRDWLLSFFNNCTETKKIPKLWRQAKVVALLKPGKDPPVAKSFRPISLLCHTYKLFERLILVVALVNGSSRRRSYVSCYLYYFAAGLHVYILTLVLQDIESHYWGNYVVMNGEVFVILASFDPCKCDVFMRDGLPIRA